MLHICREAFFKPLYVWTHQYIDIVASRSSGKTLNSVERKLWGLWRKQYEISAWYTSTMTVAKKTFFPIIEETAEYWKHKRICQTEIDRMHGEVKFIFGKKDVRKVWIASYAGEGARGPHPGDLLLDEIELAPPNFFEENIDPAIAHMGFKANVLMIGTPKGRNQFYDYYQKGLVKNPIYRSLAVKMSEHPEIFSPEFVKMKREQYPPEIFAQEFECDFDASVDNCYVYAPILYGMSKEGRITDNLWVERNKPLFAAFDIGYANSACWIYQINNNNYPNWLHYYQWKNKSARDIFSELRGGTYEIDELHLPHDAKNHGSVDGATWATVAADFGYKVKIVPKDILTEQDQGRRWDIRFARTSEILKNSYIHRINCQAGIDVLYRYRTAKDTKLGIDTHIPLHDINSHGADAFKTACDAKTYWSLDYGMINKASPGMRLII